jgi:hypothetical protein
MFLSFLFAFVGRLRSCFRLFAMSTAGDLDKDSMSETWHFPHQGLDEGAK